MQKIVTSWRPITLVYAALAIIVVCCFLIFITKQTGSCLRLCLLNQQICDEENSVDGEHGSSNHPKEVEGYYSTLCELDR